MYPELMYKKTLPISTSIPSPVPSMFYRGCLLVVLLVLPQIEAHFVLFLHPIILPIYSSNLFSLPMRKIWQGNFLIFFCDFQAQCQVTKLMIQHFFSHIRSGQLLEQNTISSLFSFPISFQFKLWREMN